MAQKMSNMQLVNKNNFSEFAAKVALDDFVPVKNRRLVVEEEPVGKDRETRRNRRRNARAAKKHEAEVKWFKKNRNSKQERGTDNCGYQYVVTPIILECGVRDDGVFHFRSTEMIGAYIVNDRRHEARHNGKVECHDAMVDKVVDGEVHIPKHIHEWIMDKWYDGLMSMIQNDEEGEIPDVTVEDYWAHFNEYVDPDELGKKGYNVTTTAGEDGVFIRYKDGYYDRHLRLGYNSKFLDAAHNLRIQREIAILENKKRQLLEEYAERISALNDMIRRREGMMK